MCRFQSPDSPFYWKHSKVPSYQFTGEHKLYYICQKLKKKKERKPPIFRSQFFNMLPLICWTILNTNTLRRKTQIKSFAYSPDREKFGLRTFPHSSHCVARPHYEL